MASNDRILVSSQVLIETASKFRNNVQRMRELLDEATRNINQTTGSWSGQAAESLRSKYDRLKTTFEPFCQNVEAFAKFLDQSASSYEETERTIERAAEEVISDIGTN